MGNDWIDLDINKLLHITEKKKALLLSYTVLRQINFTLRISTNFLNYLLGCDRFFTNF